MFLFIQAKVLKNHHTNKLERKRFIKKMRGENLDLKNEMKE